MSFSGHTPKNPLDFVSVAVASIMAFCGRPKTALGEFAKCLQQEKAPDLSMKFPMYVVSLQNVLKMTEVRCHQQLLEDGILTTKGDSGKAMFLSHQWVSQQHPDPDGKQLKVFQDAMKNLLDGSTVPNYSAWAEIMSVYLGRPRFATSDLSETSLFVWYDYFSIPQYTVTAQSRSVSTNLYEDQRNGILSISAYIHRCEFLVVLCPSMKHATLPADVNYHSWAERGWCRLEAMARELSVKNGSVLVIEGPKQVMLSSTWQSAFLAPGEGKFTVPDDREVVGKVLTDMLHKKLHDFLVKGDLCGYRLLLSRQHAWLRKCKVAPVPALLATSDAETDFQGMVEEFLLQYGFSKVGQYDKVGWSPLCYAALGGHPEVLEALLSKRANPNESLRKPCPGAMLMKGQSALAICVRFGNNEAMRILLQANADLNQPDCNGSSPLCHAGHIDNVEGARLLVEARADATVCGLGANAFQWAAGLGATEVVKELYNIPGAATSLEEILHGAILTGQGSTNHIEMLLSIGCDINEQSCLRLAPRVLRPLLRIEAVKHSLLAPTPLSTFAYHYRGATPLMVSIFVGSYAIAGFLLEAKARIDLCNSRKQTAFDLAVQQTAPDALLWNLWKRGAGSYASQASVSWWCAHMVSLTVGPESEGMLEDGVDDLDPLDPMISMNF